MCDKKERWVSWEVGLGGGWFIRKSNDAPFIFKSSSRTYLGLKLGELVRLLFICLCT